MSKKLLKQLLLITLGTALMAFGIINFAVTNQMAEGGFTGITIILASLTSSTNWLSKIVSKFGDWILMFLKYVFAGIADAIVEESAPSVPSVDGGQPEGGIFEPVEYSELWLKIQELLDILYKVFIFVLVVAIIYYGTRAIIQFVKTNFTKNRVKVNKTNDHYGDRIKNAAENIDSKEEKRMSPEVVGKKVFKIANKKKPKQLVIVGGKYKFFYFMKKVFPLSWVHGFLYKYFGGFKKAKTKE